MQKNKTNEKGCDRECVGFTCPFREVARKAFLRAWTMRRRQS